jgi:hypothetical protein
VSKSLAPVTMMMLHAPTTHTLGCCSALCMASSPSLVVPSTSHTELDSARIPRA